MQLHSNCLGRNLDSQRRQLLVYKILDFRLVLCFKMVEAILGFKVLGNRSEFLWLDIDLIRPIFILSHSPHSGFHSKFCCLDRLIGRKPPSFGTGSVDMHERSSLTIKRLPDLVHQIDGISDRGRRNILDRRMAPNKKPPLFNRNGFTGDEFMEPSCKGQIILF